MRTAIVVVLVLGCWAGVARADAHADAQVAFGQGQAFYTDHEYLKAAAAFEEAYRLERDPAYLFNIAQAYRMGRECAKAVDYYHRFLAEVPSPPELSTLQHWVTEAKACAADQEREKRAAKGRHTEMTPGDPGKRKAGMISASIGVLGLGVGAYFSIRAKHFQSNREGLCGNQRPPCMWNADDTTLQHLYDDLGHRANLVMTVSYIAGGAALVGGAVLYVLGRPKTVEHFAVIPTIGGGMVTGQLSF